jgi:glyceraldehyde-3-phosphate dehydrogenase/erythrose-4-phosphate dehydrogenase
MQALLYFSYLNGSCTKNSAALVVEVSRERIGIRKAILNTMHEYTATQRLVDTPARSYSFNLQIPATVQSNA